MCVFVVLADFAVRLRYGFGDVSLFVVNSLQE